MKRFSFGSTVRTLFLLALVFPAAQARAGFNRWTSIGPAGGRVLSLAIDSGPRASIYAGTESGIFRSTDGGSTWTPLGAGVVNVAVRALHVDRDSNVYAVTTSSVYRSRDGGSTWTLAAGEGLPAGSPLFAIDAGASTLYAVFGGQIYRSTTGADSWELVARIDLGTARSRPTSFAALGSNLYLGMERSRCLGFDFCPPVGGTIFQSRDGGSTWQRRDFEHPVLSLVIDPTSAVYAGFGASFLSAGSLQSVRKSSDGGATWTAVSVGINGPISALATAPGSGTVYAVSQDSGLFRTDDGGSHWVRLFGPSGGRAIAVDPVSSAVFVGAEEGLLRTSGDGNWERLDLGLARLDLAAIAFDPATASTLYVGGQGAVFRSSNAGATWIRETAGLGKAFVQDLAIDPNDPRTLFAATDTGVFRSVDSGESWQEVNTGLTSLFISDLAVDPADPSILYAIAPDAGVFRTMNRGGRWSAVNNGLAVTQGYSLAVDPVTSTVYAGTYGGVFRSSDRGDHWIAASTGLTTLGIYDVAVAPSLSTTLYAGTGDGVFRSVDAGATWSRAGLEHESAARITVHPTNPQIVYVASFGTVFRTADGGVNWTRTAGLEEFPVSRTAVDPYSTSDVYAVTYSGSAYRIGFRSPSICSGGVGSCKKSGKKVQ